MEMSRRDHLASLNTFRATQQTPQQRREYDLNDPRALRKGQPARRGDDDPQCGVSGMQRFEGEDLGVEERLKAQMEQRRAWAEQQVLERNRKKEEEEDEMRYVGFFLLNRGLLS